MTSPTFPKQASDGGLAPDGIAGMQIRARRGLGWTRKARCGTLDGAHLHKHMLRQRLSVWQVMVQVFARHGGGGVCVK